MCYSCQSGFSYTPSTNEPSIQNSLFHDLPLLDEFNTDGRQKSLFPSWGLENSGTKIITWSIAEEIDIDPEWYDSLQQLAPGAESRVFDDVFSFDWKSAIRESFGMWSDVLDIVFMETADSGDAFGFGQHADIRISAFEVVAPTLAFAFFPWTIHASAGDIVLGYNRPEMQDRDGFITIMAHEIGHSIGLLHSNNVGDLMYPIFNPEIKGPQEGDIVIAQKTHFAPKTNAQLLSEELGLITTFYEAAFNREPDVLGTKYWHKLLTSKYDWDLYFQENVEPMPAKTFAWNLIGSDEFNERWSIDSELAFVDILYRNTLDREGDFEGLMFWTNQLNFGEMDRADVLIYFAESPENQANMLEKYGEVGWWEDTFIM